MSMLGEQIKELREAAEKFEGYQCGEVSRMLREAADTITSLRDRLQSVPAELDYIEDKSRWFQLFGTPEKATQTLVTQNFACRVWGDCLRCPFGEGVCPENLPLSEDAEQKMLEWLRNDAE